MVNRILRGGGAWRLRAAAGAALLALCTTLPAMAAEKKAEKKSVAEQLLEIMRAKNMIDEQQYEDLLAQARAEQAERATPAVSAAEAPAKTGSAWDVGWNNGFYVNKSDGDVKLKFGGLIQTDGAVVNESHNLEQAMGGVGTGTEFRRARIHFEGSVYENAIFKAEYDFAGGVGGFKDVWIGLQKIPYIERIRVGHMKEPFSLDQMTSDKYTTFMERALPDVFAPARNTGVMINRTFADDRIYAGVGGFANTNDSSGNAFTNNANYNIAARLTGLPLYADEGAQLLHVGASYSHDFGGGGTLSLSQRPEAHLAPRIVNTGTINGVSGADLVGGEFAGIFGPLSFQSELISSFIERGVGPTNPTFWGAYGQVSWFLTGESRPWDRAEAVFGRPSPKHPFSVKNGTWGAWELAARYSYLTLDDKGVRGGIASDITGGLNWYLYPNLRMTFNYVYANRHGLGDASIAESRVQLDF